MKQFKLTTALATAREEAAKLQPVVAAFEARYPQLREPAYYVSLPPGAEVYALFATFAAENPSAQAQDGVLTEFVRLASNDLRAVRVHLDRVAGSLK